MNKSDALVFFGITGDLANKKVIPSLYTMVRRGRLDVPVVGVAKAGWGLDQLKERVRQSVEHAGNGTYDQAALDKLLSLLRYVDGDYADTATYDSVSKELGAAQAATFYLAIPPSLFGVVVKGLGDAGCAGGARVVVEKPFGRDLPSAQELNEVLHTVFAESQIFRIDHYLGKEETQNILYMRFANSLLEPIWNRTHVASIEITMSEDFGVEGRGTFYDAVGCLRDVIENHLFQLVALLAMDPPVDGSAEAQRDEKGKVFKAMRSLRSGDMVRGQYEGYRDEKGVAPDSDTETFCALKLWVDSWRWAGVPWYLRAGKNLAVHATEVVIELKPPPHKVFAGDTEPSMTNYVRFQLNPRVTIAIGVRVKVPGEGFTGEHRELVLHDDHPEEMGPYERLLGDAMEGDSALFARVDSVEAAWRVVDPVLADHDPAIAYAVGSCGPPQADDLIAVDGGWHQLVAEQADG